MPLMLDDIRREFADFLSADPSGRFRMDAALAHVVTKAYQQGLADASTRNLGSVSPINGKESCQS